MTPESPAILERLLRDNDLGWMIDMYAPRERAYRRGYRNDFDGYDRR